MTVLLSLTNKRRANFECRMNGRDLWPLDAKEDELSKRGFSGVLAVFLIAALSMTVGLSAKQLFGEYFNAFLKAYNNEDARKELRTTTVSDYVNLNGLAVAQYQDYGWEPVKLYK